MLFSPSLNPNFIFFASLHILSLSLFSKSLSFLFILLSTEVSAFKAFVLIKKFLNPFKKRLFLPYFGGGQLFLKFIVFVLKYLLLFF